MKMMRNKKLIILAAGAVVLAIGLAAGPALAAELVNLSFPCPSGPGNCQSLASSTSIGSFLNSLYQIALGISGLLALLMIVGGGVYYTVSAGNTSKQGDAKDMITSALWGLALLLGAYLVLNTINPQITALNLPGNEYNPVPTSTNPNLAVPNTECLTTSTAMETIDASSSYNQLTPNGGATWTGNSYADSKTDPTLNCAYRVGYVSSGQSLEIKNDGRYYNENETIPAGSEVWQYPYFSSSSDPTASDRCLIYAYLPPDTSSSPTMINLNSNLQLCYPHNQQVAINPGSNNPGSGFGSYDPNALQQNVGCNNQTTCAAKFYYSGYVTANAPNTTALLQCLTDKNILLAVPYYTYDQSYPICNYTRGQGTTCSHAVNSCHYGGANPTFSHDPSAPFNQGALAIDFAVKGQTASSFINAAEVGCAQYIKSGSPGTNGLEARCENGQGQQVSCTDSSATHVHITVEGCNAN